MTHNQQRAYNFFYSLLVMGVGFRHENGVVAAVGAGVSPVLQKEVRKWSPWIAHYIPPQGIAPDYRQDGSKPKPVEPKTVIQKWSENSVDERGQSRDGSDRNPAWRNRGYAQERHGQAQRNGVASGRPQAAT